MASAVASHTSAYAALRNNVPITVCLTGPSYNSTENCVFIRAVFFLPFLFLNKEYGTRLNTRLTFEKDENYLPFSVFISSIFDPDDERIATQQVMPQ